MNINDLKAQIYDLMAEQEQLQIAFQKLEQRKKEIHQQIRQLNEVREQGKE